MEVCAIADVFWEAAFPAWQEAQVSEPTNSSREGLLWVGQNPGSDKWSAVESWADAVRTPKTIRSMNPARNNGNPF